MVFNRDCDACDSQYSQYRVLVASRSVVGTPLLESKNFARILSSLIPSAATVTQQLQRVGVYQEISTKASRNGHRDDIYPIRCRLRYFHHDTFRVFWRVSDKSRPPFAYISAEFRVRTSIASVIQHPLRRGASQNVDGGIDKLITATNPLRGIYEWRRLRYWDISNMTLFKFLILVSLLRRPRFRVLFTRSGTKFRVWKSSERRKCHV